MGELTRAKDWSKTSLGNAETWPQSLRTTLSILLRSDFPMFLFWGPDSICFYNDAYRQILGKEGKHPTILGMNGAGAWPEIWTTIKPWIDIVLNESKALWKEDLLVPIYRNGKLDDVYWTFSYSPITDESGSTAGVFVTVVETTDKINIIKRLGESEQDLQSLVLQAPIGICVIDAYTRVVEIVNDSFIEIAGNEEISGKLYEDAFAGAKSNYDSAYREVVEMGKSVYADEVKLKLVRHKKEEVIYVTFVYEPVKDMHGVVKKVAIWAFENTRQVMARQKVEETVAARTIELKQLNESLKKSEERYHLMVAEVQDYAILYLNPDGIVENWNLGAQKIKGYSASEIIGKNFSTFYTEEDRKNNLPNTLLERARQSGRAMQEGWRVRKDQSLFWASVVITAVHNDERKVIGFSKVTHDLTEKKIADDQLKMNTVELEQKNTELERMNKELESFAYISSHDLQEPLRKIRIFSSQILERESDNLSDSGKLKVNRMQDAAQRMQVLIEDLLSYSRTNIAERKFEAVDFNKIVDEVKEDLSEELLQKHAIIETKDTCEVTVIPFQFRQLLFNLISNSLKFSGNTDTPRIVVKCKIDYGVDLNNSLLNDDTRYFHLSVADNGIGFEPEYSQKIFEVFQRLHGKHEYKGTGIGLAIVKKIVENHNGIITASGEPGKGATFDIYFPQD